MRGAYSNLGSTDQFLEFNVPSSSYKADYLMNKESTEVCKNCKKKLVMEERDGDICCKACGTVLDKTTFDGNKEWTGDDTFRLTDAMESSGSSFNASDQYADIEIGTWGDRTIIGDPKNPNKVYHKDGKLRKIFGDKKKELDRLRKEAKIIHGKKHVRSWEEWNKRFKALLNKTHPDSIDHNGLPTTTIAETSILLFEKCLRKGLEKGQHILLVMASCIRLARKLHGLPIDFDSIDNDLGYRMKNFHMYYKIKSELDLKFNDYENELLYKILHKITTEICNTYGFEKKDKIFNSALKIIEAASAKGVTGGKVPENIVAAAVYLSCKQHECEISIYEMEKVVKPSSTTIKKIAKELTEN